MSQGAFYKELEDDLTLDNVNMRIYENIGKEIGKLVDEKNVAYGDAFNKSGDFLEILYPNGIQPHQYDDMLAIIRVFDKLMRISTQKEAFKENPWEDIAGYGILRSMSNGKKNR
ncbi:hypothetical protein QNH23_06345 [Siminovitchia fortis]|uniref:Uncharacterized protein n=1 Tax=Siminovitchia fortis TaxID=254758 RepID=A0A443IM40_9BACI|nr:hypothetical protein [Siminovitchia fortis]RWR06725.1 hypothetical protein D4N35_013750 [Siminovitchia fortis]WHY82991.1 hypothetical protein QNH23_06345 [Siminovitchia fortis]